MSIASFTSHKQGVQDLLAALPAPATPANERSRSKVFDQESKPGFNDLLRDSAKTQQPKQGAESTEPVDAPPRAESPKDGQATADKPDPVNQANPTKDAGDNETQETNDQATSEQDKAKQSSEDVDSQPKDTSGEAEVQAAAAAASAQLSVVKAVDSEQSKTQAQANIDQQVGLAKAVESVSKGQSSEHIQSASTNLLTNGALPNQAQSASSSAVQAESVATVRPVLPQGETAQTGTGDSGSDSKSASTGNTATTNANASSNSNTAAATVISVPDQSGGESRLPISSTTTTPTADATRLAQAQSLNTSSDNDSINTARLTRGLASAVQQRGGAVTLRLTPPEMGTVRIQMQITGTNVSASFHAESASAQTLLTTQLAQLRTALESKGMSVERLSVQPLAATAQSNNTSQSQNQGDTQQQGQSQQHSAGDGRSRGQYSSDSSGRQSSDPQSDSAPGQQAPRGFFERLYDASEEQAV